MTTTIDLAHAHPTLNELLDIAAAGNEVVLMMGGKLVATLQPPVQSSLAQPEEKRRTPGLQPDAFIYVSEDFDAPLPDSFWLGSGQ